MFKHVFFVVVVVVVVVLIQGPRGLDGAAGDPGPQVSLIITTNSDIKVIRIWGIH